MIRLERAFWTGLTWLVVVATAFPLFWMLGSAFKTPEELFAKPPTFLPRAPTLKNFADVLGGTNFLTYAGNSLIVATATTAIVLVIVTLGAHAMTAFRLRGRKTFARALLLAYMMPTTAVLIPIYLMIAGLGVANTLPGLIIAYTSLALPFGLWMMRAFFANIPPELEAAATIDGASRLGAFFDVVLPQAVPGIITTGVFTFLLCWNEYLYALVMINDDARRTLPTGIMGTLVTGYAIEWGMVMAAATMMSVPLLLVFLLLQRYVVQGFGAGAIKG
ncbi:carbohydrate ABC transporter permease [Roseomonas sp. OT10]|uniref:carbohydrate ABC transporter permease n=1 Tax=Roseomonas cutis TaxID=2897332 RepID=UPI001E4E098E|nr:carbohydrate ABC transporter permease [Roseomonas sp. OT10]UFN49276.1 carbohydrate ABC transporter permease [Roseomonas sp. OT10]